jgi:hypothetical protein
MFFTTNLELLTIPALKNDLSNWVTYKTRLPNAATYQGLGRHLNGTAKIPKIITEVSGDWYLPGNATPLTEEEIEKYLDAQDKYNTKEAQLREIIYQTIPNSLFLRVKAEPTGYDVWKRLCSAIEEKFLVRINAFKSEIMNLRTPKDGDIRVTLA